MKVPCCVCSEPTITLTTAKSQQKKARCTKCRTIQQTETEQKRKARVAASLPFLKASDMHTRRKPGDKYIGKARISKFDKGRDWYSGKAEASLQRYRRA